MSEPYYDPSEQDDSDLTREEFEVAVGFPAFPTITIPDPAAVGAWLDKEFGVVGLQHSPRYSASGWSCNHWHLCNDFVTATGNTTWELVDDLRCLIAEYDPHAKLRKEAEAAGYVLVKSPTD